MQPLRVGYVAVFATAGLLCFAALPRASLLSDEDTKRGFAGLVVISGVWAVVTAVQLSVNALQLKIALYTIGLTAGFISVFAWLYFCSAYAGRRFHRNTRYQALALGICLLVLGLKYTNPIHGQYFSTTLATEPFPHLIVNRLALDWTVTVLAYALSGAGFVLLFRALERANYPRRSLWVVLACAGLPAVASIAAPVTGFPLLDLNYEPIGVALFGMAVVYFVEEKFTAVSKFGRGQLFDELDDPIVVVDDTDRVVEYNDAAVDMFPTLDGSNGKPLAVVEPRIAGHPADSELISIETDEGPRYLRPREKALTVGTTTIGHIIPLADVTRLERRRQELVRQNEQLDDFAAAVDHELRNAVSLVEGYVGLARGDVDGDVEESLEVIERAATRMADVVGDLTTLARYGQTLDETEPCSIGATARAAWDQTVTDEMSLTVDSDGTVLADPDRLAALFCAVFEFAHINGASVVQITLDGETLRITDDGKPIPDGRFEDAFDYNAAVPSAEAGMLLPNVRTLATVHGWETSLDPTYDGGIRLHIKGLTRAEEVEAAS